MALEFTIELLETDAKIVSNIRRELVKTLRRAFNNAARGIENRVKAVVRIAIESQPEYQELFGGKLQEELGLPDPDTQVREVVNQWIRNISLKVQQPAISSLGIRGKISLEMIRSDWQDVLSLPAAVYVTENDQVIEWLRWLLIEGDRAIVRDYVIGRNPRRSRTGLGSIMIKKQGGNWRVPPEFAGVENNNFVTRALRGINKTLDDIFREELIKNVK